MKNQRRLLKLQIPGIQNKLNLGRIFMQKNNTKNQRFPKQSLDIKQEKKKILS